MMKVTPTDPVMKQGTDAIVLSSILLPEARRTDQVRSETHGRCIAVERFFGRIEAFKEIVSQYDRYEHSLPGRVHGREAIGVTSMTVPDPLSIRLM